MPVFHSQAIVQLDRLRGLVTATLSHTGFADDDSGSDVEGRAVTSKAGSRPDLHHTSGVGVLSEQDKHARRTPSHNGSQRSGGGHRNKIGEQVHVGTQTEDAYDDDEEGSIDGEGRKGRREGRTTRNPLHPPPHIVPWPLPTALKNLQAIYTVSLLLCVPVHVSPRLDVRRIS